MLAHVGDDRLDEVLKGLDDEHQRLVRRGVNAVRRNGFAINNQAT